MEFNLETFTLASVTLTNLLAVPAIFKLWKCGRIFGSLLTATSFSASVLMHITETKHNLPGLCWSSYSNIFLNIDRVFAGLTGLYGCYLYFDKNKNLPISGYDTTPVLTLLLGSLCLKLGEMTNNLYAYNLFHNIWHYCAFKSLEQVVH
jgi:hypothetical protein